MLESSQASRALLDTDSSQDRSGRAAFSLLEVILALAIIAASAMVLLRLISTGEQHQRRGERRATGQMICQSLIDQMTINPELRQNVEDQSVAGHPQWTYTAKVEPTEFPGLVRIRIRASETPLVDRRTPDDGRFDFQLVRWLRSDDNSADRANESEDSQ